MIRAVTRDSGSHAGLFNLVSVDRSIVPSQPIDDPVEPHPNDERHDVIAEPLILSKAKHWDNVRMAKAGCQPCFPLKPLPPKFVLAEPPREQLDGNAAAH